MENIYFDMDGTIANFYGVDGWLESILNRDATPYRVAKPLVNMSALARVLNRLQREGHKICIISWLAKNSTDEYDMMVTEAKMEWLKVHLKSVHFDSIEIVKYGTPKHEGRNGILFDDEKPNRDAWGCGAYDVNNIIEILKKL